MLQTWAQVPGEGADGRLDWSLVPERLKEKGLKALNLIGRCDVGRYLDLERFQSF